jgi:hypothetical protein|tara:strand:- start:910 stop:1083 length:174 start_codon:yes stop_codon:yes gene_type:complete
VEVVVVHIVPQTQQQQQVVLVVVDLAVILLLEIQGFLQQTQLKTLVEVVVVQEDRRM